MKCSGKRQGKVATVGFHCEKGLLVFEGVGLSDVLLLFSLDSFSKVLKALVF